MSAPSEFSFPFTPYDIQKDFMQNLYEALENGKLGIFESPTGTGKSLSLCCGAIQWLKDHNEAKKKKIVEEIDKLKLSAEEKSEDDDWLKSEYDKIQKNMEILSLQKTLNAINERNDRINKLRERGTIVKIDKNRIKQKYIQQKIEKDKENKSNNDVEILSENREGDKDLHDDDDIDLVLDDVIEPNKEINDDEVEEDKQEEFIENGTKIFYCSRTHSQLSQFISEIKKTSHSADISVISLASRQQYCINPSVQKLKSQHLINEICLDLQKGKSGKATSKADDGKITKRAKKSSGCPYYNQTNLEILKEEALISIKDIEDLVETAMEIKCCPYYGARATVSDAQVIVVPYQTLLHEGTRKANGIDLKDNIVIIDEAHNLLDTIGHIYSSEISGMQLQIAVEKMELYKEKYITRFATKNLLQLNQMIYIAGKLLKLLKMPSNSKNTIADSKILTLESFVISAEIDNYNLRPLIEFCNQAKLPQKLHGFSEKCRLQGNEQPKLKDKKQALQDFLIQMSKSKNKSDKSKSEIEETPTESESVESEKYISVGNVIQVLISFLSTLTNKYDDGRILSVKSCNLENSFHKFLLLNPATQFTNIVKEARSVIVAGGTMQPFSEFKDQLFISAGASPERILQFSCGHIIPPENILPICLSDGPSGKKLNFTYEKRNTPDMLNEIGRIIVNVCNIVPGGIVCFFPSYDYEKLVYNHLNTTKVLEKIQKKKKIFREPKSTTNVDQILEEYSKTIKRCKNSDLNIPNITGALMLSVVGGKLSEGLNFSDDLGRCVIVVGMPYPNIKSIELQEKMKYLKENVSSNAGQIHYENLCMKAVNQCIGRAVRHAKDYATVLLLDERYSRESVYTSLPKWIQKSLVINAKFGSAFGSIGRFFSKHK